MGNKKPVGPRAKVSLLRGGARLRESEAQPSAIAASACYAIFVVVEPDVDFIPAGRNALADDVRGDAVPAFYFGLLAFVEYQSFLAEFM